MTAPTPREFISKALSSILKKQEPSQINHARMQMTAVCDDFGELKPGKKADITFLDVKTNKVRMTVMRGQIVYRAEE